MAGVPGHRMAPCRRGARHGAIWRATGTVPPSLVLRYYYQRNTSSGVGTKEGLKEGRGAAEFYDSFHYSLEISYTPTSYLGIYSYNRGISVRISVTARYSPISYR